MESCDFVAKIRIYCIRPPHCSIYGKKPFNCVRGVQVALLRKDLPGASTLVFNGSQGLQRAADVQRHSLSWHHNHSKRRLHFRRLSKSFP